MGRLRQAGTPARLEGQIASSRWVGTASANQGQLVASTSRNQNTGLLSTKPSRLTSGQGLSTARTIPLLRMTGKPEKGTSTINTIYKYRALPLDTASLLGRGATRNFQIGVKIEQH